MPQKQEKKNEKDKQKVDTRPSVSLIRRLFGLDAMSPATAEGWPELQRAWASHEMQRPEETGRTNRVFNMGPLSKFFLPQAYAVTGPFGTIGLNRELIDKDKQSVDDVLAHELAHIKQGKRGFLRNYYEPTAVENEAINAEAMRYRPRDINLPVEKKKR